MALELALIGVLILLNGFFAGAEIAVVSARRSRLQVLAESGRSAAASALRLKKDPDRFLATVQIGVTVVGTLASAVGGVAAVERLEPAVMGLPWPALQRVAEPLAVAVVVVSIAYLSLVVGELVPKSLAVRHSEGIALLVSPLIEWLSRATRPAVAFLTASSRLVLRILGQRGPQPHLFHTLEDLRAIAEEAQEQGVLKADLVTGAVEFHERQVREVLTPRPRIEALPVAADLPTALRVVAESGHSRFPLYDNNLDQVLGVVFARDVYHTALREQPFDLRKMARPVPIVPATKAATELLAEMRRDSIQMAIVVDEHGSVLGLVTLEDLVEVIVGEIQDQHRVREPLVRAVGTGIIEAEGSVPVHQLNDDHGFRLPESPDYVTVAGLVLQRLGSIPLGGEKLDLGDQEIEVLEVKGHRLARVRISLRTADRP
jgi:putative hemolysin